jgi:hypothetical protein
MHGGLGVDHTYLYRGSIRSVTCSAWSATITTATDGLVVPPSRRSPCLNLPLMQTRDASTLGSAWLPCSGIPSAVRFTQEAWAEEGRSGRGIDTPVEVLMTPQEVTATKALDRVGEPLRESGTTLEELIESGREERAQIVMAGTSFSSR